MDQDQGQNFVNEQHLVDQINDHLMSLFSDSNPSLLSEMGHWTFDNPGKMLRSRMIFRLGRIFEVRIERVLLWGVICELIHNASLVHDDLQDGDPIRRDRDSIWFRFGKGQAVNFGDYLLVQPFRLIAENQNLADDEKSHLNLLVAQTISQLVVGQIGDIGFRNDQGSQSFKNYMQVTQEKTGTLFKVLLAGLQDAIPKGPMKNLADQCLDILEDSGIFYQMVDDTLDLFGDKGRDHQGCDVFEGKYSFLVTMHQRFVPGDVEALGKILQKSRKKTDIFDVEWFKGRLEQSGTLEKCFKYFGIKLEEIDRKITALDHQPLTMILRLFISEILKPLKSCKEFSILRNHCASEFDY